MKAESLIKDPVFQLNLLLWMTKEQPADDYRVRPLFYEWGFEIIYIEQPFAFPEETIKVMKDLKLEVCIPPEPELILGRNHDNKALYFEAKANSFGIDSTNCKQARGHLIASGPVFGEVFSPLEACLLCYVVPEKARNLMSECLKKLANDLEDKNLFPAEFSCHGLAVNEEQVVYSWDRIFRAYVDATEDEIPIMKVDGDTDPAPLLLVFSDDDCNNIEMRDFYRRAIIDQVRACLLCDLHSHPLMDGYQVTPFSLLMKTTEGIFKYLGPERQKKVCRLIRENMLRKIADFWKGKLDGISFVSDNLTIAWKTASEKDEFLNWLEERRTHFSTSKPPEESLPLFGWTNKEKGADSGQGAGVQDDKEGATASE